MKKLLLSIFVVIITWGNLFAQENISVTFGDISQEEISIKSYEKDPEAEAFIIYELGKTSFVINEQTHDFDLHMYKRSRIKILKQSGLDYGNIEIPYYVDGYNAEKIQNIKAVTYNYENGILQETELNLKNVYEEKINNNWRIKKFAMPQLKEGSFIEFEYTIVSPFIFNIREWEFQHEIPTLYSGFEFRIIPFYEYIYILKGADEFDELTSARLPEDHEWGSITYKEVQYNMGMYNLPAFQDEEFITSPKDYIVSLNLQLSQVNYPNGEKKVIMTTWPDMCRKFLADESFGKYIKAAEKEAKNILATLPLENAAEEEKIKIITEYVKNNYSWNQHNDKLAGNKVSDLLKRKVGNSAELNLFLLGLLNKAGIEVKPVVLSTRNHGVIPSNYPFQHFLNYVVVLAQSGGNTLYLDATEPLLPYNELPEQCINVKGLVVDKKGNEWIDITQNNLTTTERDFVIDFSDSEFNTKYTYTSVGYKALDYRRIMENNEEKFKKSLSNDNIVIKNFSVENQNNFEQPFVFSWEVNVPYEKTEKIVIHPFQNHTPQNNLFKQNSRSLPIDLIYANKETFSSQIEIPQGYSIESLPENIHIDGKTMKINYQVESTGNTISINASFQFKKNIYEANEYQDLKESYAQLIKIFNEMIILKK